MKLSIVDTTSNAEPGQATLQLIGSLDLSTRPILIEAATRALNTAQDLRVEAAEIDFIDSVGISALEEVAYLARRAGATFEVEHASPSVRHVLEFVGLADRWTP